MSFYYLSPTLITLVCFSTFQPQAFLISGSDPDCQILPSWVSENKLNYVLFSQLLPHVEKKEGKTSMNTLKSSSKGSSDKAERRIFLSLVQLKRWTSLWWNNQVFKKSVFKESWLKRKQKTIWLGFSLNRKEKELHCFVICCKEAW